MSSVYYLDRVGHANLSGNDQAFLNATGYDHPTFLKLAMKFKRYFYRFEKRRQCMRKLLMVSRMVENGIYLPLDVWVLY